MGGESSGGRGEGRGWGRGCGLPARPPARQPVLPPAAAGSARWRCLGSFSSRSPPACPRCAVPSRARPGADTTAIMPAVSKGDGMRGLAVFISDIRNCERAAGGPWRRGAMN